MNLNEILSIVSVVVFLVPIGFKVFILIGQKSHNIKIQNLVARAEIIVTALDQTDLRNEDKKMAALQKLSLYAKEVGIKATPQQIDDYIESAVNFIRQVTK